MMRIEPQTLPSSQNPQSRVTKIAAGVAPARVSPAGENAAPDPDFRMIITAPNNRPYLVQIYEPRQSLEQEEVILEEFPIDGGETVKKEKRSATAAFRFLPLTEQVRAELEKKRLAKDDPLQLTVGQEGFVTPETEEEMAAGSERQADFEAAENAPLESPRKRKVSGGAERSGTANQEIRRGAADAEGQPVRVAEPVPRGHKDETVGEHLARNDRAAAKKQGRPRTKNYKK
jgi:hypothetical protein